MTTRPKNDILQGTLTLLVLRSLEGQGPLHGYALCGHIQRVSDDTLRVEEGSLYPALQRMLIKGWVTGEWGRTAENRRARYYKLTAAGRKRLESELASYERVSIAIARILRQS